MKFFSTADFIDDHEGEIETDTYSPVQPFNGLFELWRIEDPIPAHEHLDGSYWYMRFDRKALGEDGITEDVLRRAIADINNYTRLDYHYEPNLFNDNKPIPIQKECDSFTTDDNMFKFADEPSKTSEYTPLPSMDVKPYQTM